MSAVAFSAAFIALYVGHTVGDYWVQAPLQALGKSARTPRGRALCLAHVCTLTLTQMCTLLLMELSTGLRLPPNWVFIALLVNAASHYWADRRFTLEWLAKLIGKEGFYRLGAPRPDHDDNPSLGTGAHALDQSWHLFFLFLAALLMGL